MLCSGMGASMLAMAAGLHLKQLAGLSSTIAITGTVAYMVFFALGAGPVPGLLVPEVTPARLRGERSSYHASHLIPNCCRFWQLHRALVRLRTHLYCSTFDVAFAKKIY